MKDASLPHLHSVNHLLQRIASGIRPKPIDTIDVTTTPPVFLLRARQRPINGMSRAIRFLECVFVALAQARY